MFTVQNHMIQVFNLVQHKTAMASVTICGFKLTILALHLSPKSSKGKEKEKTL